MTPYERLMAEAIPVRPEPPGPRPPWTPQEQQQHRTDLLTALNGWHWQDNTRTSARRRHLHLIHHQDRPTTDTEAA